MYNNEYICLWHILDYSHKILLGLCVFIFGLIALVLNGWMFMGFLKSRLLIFRCHLMLLGLCLASLLKAFLGGFLLAGPSGMAGRWLYGVSTCQLFAFVRQMLAVFQMFALTLISVERYAITRPKRKGAELSLRFYLCGLSVCWLAAILFCLPPLLGYGRYSCDVSGTNCDLDWRMLFPRQIAFNILVIVFAGLFPVLTMFVCLWSANCIMSRRDYYGILDQTSFTKTMTIMILLVLLFWTPQGVLAMWIFAQNLHPPRGIPVALAVIAPIASEAADLIPVLCYLTRDECLRSALMEICERFSKVSKGKHKSVKYIMK